METDKTKIVEKNENNGYLFQFFVAVIANLIVVTDGVGVGWTGPMIPYFLSKKSHIPMTQSQAEGMETILLVGAIVGLPITAFSINRLGRKKPILMGTFVLIVCWTVVALADRIEYIYAARFFNGLGLNLAFIAAPMYVGEIAHKNIRGFLSSIVFISSHIGVVVIYCIGPYVPFYVPSIVCVVLLTIELTVFWFMPESAYYLLLKNKPEEAKKSLMKFRGKDTDVDEELQEMIKAIELDKQSTGDIRDLLFVKNYRKSLIIMIVLNFAQLFACAELIVMNLHLILLNAGTLYMDSRLAAIIFSIIYTISSILASLMIDRFGRRFLLIVSSLLTGMCLLVLAVYFHLKYDGFNTLPYSWVPIVTIMIYAATFKFGMGIVPIVITAEIFATKIKTIGMTIADGVYVVASILALQLFFSLRNLAEMHLPFYLFCACTFLACIYIIIYLPETKGKSLDEIQTVLRGERSDKNDTKKTIKVIYK